MLPGFGGLVATCLLVLAFPSKNRGMSPLKNLVFMPWSSSVFSSLEGLHYALSNRACSEHDLSMTTFPAV